MRRGSAGKVAAALWVGLAASAARAQDREPGDLHSLPPVKESSWSWSAWFGHKEAKPEAKPAPTPAPAPAADKAPPATPRPLANDPLSVLDREQNAYHRRMEVCLQLEQFAVDTDNQELQRQVEELKKRAFDVYQQRALRLGGGPAPVDPLDADEKALTKDAAPWGGGPQRAAAQVREGKP
jgi:hypothetical protein